MEPRTATHAAASDAPEHTEARKSARKPAPRRSRAKTKDESMLLRNGRQMVRAVAAPVARFWEDRLREPVAKGLITTGAVLTATGRLILEYGREKADRHTAHAPAGRPAAGKEALH